MVLKTLFDYLLALIMLPVLLPIIIVLTIISTVDTGESGLFMQDRVGKNGKIFKILKIRTMKGKYDSDITLEGTHHITKIGRFIRKTKLDETPQLLNVLLGQMSFVGPRPDVPGYADKLKGEDRVILSVKPGITGPAQIAFREEDKILAQQDDPLTYNDEVLWPEKVKINKNYVLNRSFMGDLRLIFCTVF